MRSRSSLFAVAMMAIVPLLGAGSADAKERR